MSDNCVKTKLMLNSGYGNTCETDSSMEPNFAVNIPLVAILLISAV
jgi:hypothetical protein